MTTAEALRTLQNAFLRAPEAPAGWYNQRQLSELLCVPEGSIGRVINRALKTGGIRKQRFYVPGPGGGNKDLYQPKDPSAQLALKLLLTQTQKAD